MVLARKLGFRRTLRLGMLAFETYLAVQARRRHSRPGHEVENVLTHGALGLVHPHPRSLVNLTLSQLMPLVCAGFAATAMVRLGTATKQLGIRRPRRCVACGLERADCRCG